MRFSEINQLNCEMRYRSGFCRQHPFQNLSCRRSRQVRHYLEILRYFVIREMFAAEITEFLFFNGRTIAGYHKCLRDFPSCFVFDSDDRNLFHLRMLRKNVLDFSWVNVLTG